MSNNMLLEKRKNKLDRDMEKLLLESSLSPNKEIHDKIEKLNNEIEDLEYKMWFGTKQKRLLI